MSNKMEVVSVNYEKIDNDIISIQEKPFRVTEMKLDNASVKTRFVSLGNDREIKISADKTAIKEHFKETGEVPEGCIIYTDRTSLRIK